MEQRRLPNITAVVLASLAMFLLALVACGGTAPAEPIVVEKEVLKEVEKPVVVEKEVIREIEKPVVVEKEVVKQVEVIKEVVKEVILIPTAVAVQSDDRPSWVTQGKRGGILNMSHQTATPSHWDLHLACCAQSLAMAAKYYSLLVQYDPVNPTQIVGDMARSWDVSDDGLSYTFHLHPADFNDGAPVTSQDWKFSIDRMIEPDEPRPRAGLLRPYIKDVEVVDPDTVRVNLKFQAAAFLPFMAVDYMVVMPEHLIAEPPIGMGQTPTMTSPESLVGSGPFMFDDHQKLTSTFAVRNPNYFKQGLPFVDEIRIFAMGGKATLIAAYKTEQILMHVYGGTSLSARDSIALEKELKGQVDIHWLPPTAVRLLIMNHTKPPFDDARVRRALALGIDRKDLVETIDAGLAEQGSPFVPGAGWGSEPEVVATWPGYRYVDNSGQLITEWNGRDDITKDPSDLEEARRLLAEAGYSDGLSVKVMVPNRSLTKSYSQLVKQHMRKIGVDLDLELKDTPAVHASFRKGDYEAGFIGYGINIPDPDDLFGGLWLKQGSKNQLDYEDPRIRDIFERQTRETDLSKRQALVLEAEEIIRQWEGHSTNLWWQASWGWPVNKRVKNFVPIPTIQIVYKYEHLWLDE